MKLLAPLLLCITLLAGCVQQVQPAAPPVQTVTPAQVVALDLCPQNQVCEEGGRAAVRITDDSEELRPRMQVVIQQTAEWGTEKGPPIRFDNTQRDNRRHYSHGWHNDGLNNRQRIERDFGRRHKCYTYWKHDEERPACL